jgi:hypothetical protein
MKINFENRFSTTTTAAAASDFPRSPSLHFSIGSSETLAQTQNRESRAPAKQAKLCQVFCN